ncbi:aspartate dehydrogenase [Candidatus Methanocrinis natronophilus]|uniref:L-aspartate dehydrogenase n=1 Tax=Candidatus Methanocrinis natronophilus TaxID=3033396 RepID=A0ABT5X6M7_9EURY|nr:aspartate dehydrogenase [Candidatus Methanocrinis natronophilus]MDF0590346.1 aspartate dehydrogenase [Candidatus Methanocrinis natronophilus]
MVLKIGLVGCGAIGTEIARAIDRGDIKASLVGVFDRNARRAEELGRSLSEQPRVFELTDLVERSDIVVEAASQRAVPEVAEATLERGRDLMIMSVGALLDGELRERVEDLAICHRCRVYIPSGAISGLDGLKSASSGDIELVTLTTIKNPQGFVGAPYIKEREIDLDAITEARVIFEGSAEEAVAAFPANVNVAATLSLAARGAKVMVKIVADPDTKVNIHQITAEGNFGRITTRVQNVPFPRNPKTSYLAALSAIATLRSIAEPIKIGT